jgi:phosphatidylglycerol:prolipoprotein diacylglycerol transferase
MFTSVLLRIGPVAVTWYGILIISGVFLGGVYAARQAPRRGIASDHIWNGLIIAVVLGIIGARLYHVFSSPQGGGVGWSYYREHPIEIINFWEGGFRGLGIYGAIVGGILGVVVYARYHQLPILTLLDLGGPGLALGQAIGRWGNFINQELYGPPTGSSWWGLRINADHRLTTYPIERYPEDTLFHPTFLYESLWALALFVTLALLARKLENRLLRGDIVAGYVMGYSVGRFWIEFFRPDAWMIGPLAAAQWVGAILFVGGLVFVVLRHLLVRRQPPAPVTAEP